jgi:hypothetical protein
MHVRYNISMISSQLRTVLLGRTSVLIYFISFMYISYYALVAVSYTYFLG